MEAPAFFCSTCDSSFDDAQDLRRHAKSEWHIYKLRCKVAEPGTVITPPASDDGQGDISADKEHQNADSSGPEEESNSDASNATETEDPEFDSNKCIFCPETSDTFESNTSHMKTAHSMTIPYQSSLSVEPITLIWYLHLVIFKYRECIFCGTRRRTVEAVQQHMLGKGHCRFQMTEEMMEFYDLEGKAEARVETLVKVDEESARLSNGKILAHRSQAASPTKPRARHPQPDSAQQLSPSSEEPTEETSSEALTSRERKDTALATQLSRLSVQDQRSIAHLPTSEQRSLLAIRKKQLDTARRADRRAQSRVESLGNKTLMKHYVADTPGRANG